MPHDDLWLVTGGAGFIGSNFVRYLLQKHRRLRIRVLDKFTYAGSPENLPEKAVESGQVEVLSGDILDPGLVAHALQGCSTVVHMAAETHVTRSIFDSYRFVQTDVLGTQILLAALVAQPKPAFLLHISTSEVYGTARQELMTEDHPLNPMSPYAAAKAGADRLVYSYVQTYGLPATIVRPFNNFGPYQHLEKLIPRFITGAITGSPLLIHGDGRALRDYVHVTDTCRALDLLASMPRESVLGQTFNVASGRHHSIAEIATAILAVFPDSGASPVYSPERPGQVVRHSGDSSRLRCLTGWEPRIPFEEGLKLTSDWYQRNELWWRRLWSSREVPIRLPDGSVVKH